MATATPATPATPSIGRGRPIGIDQKIALESLSGLTIKEYGGDGPYRMSVFTFTAFALAITDALAYSSVKIGTFPKGKILILGAVDYLAFTTTSAISSTLNSGATVSHGFGSAAASSITLATTMQDFLPGTGISVSNFTSSATINVAATAITGSKTSTPIPIDGSSTALPIYFNLGVPTDTQIDADATLTVTGTLVITWVNLGGYDYANT